MNGYHVIAYDKLSRELIQLLFENLVRRGVREIVE